MTDRDIVERVAAQFGTAVMAIDRGKHRTEYAATLKGSRAVDFMGEIKVLMGKRRLRAIEVAVDSYVAPARKLSFIDAEEIRRRSAAGETTSSLARLYGVTPQTIRPILRHRIYREPASRPWRHLDPPVFLGATPPAGLSLPEFLWLAGWLEGEGSFLAPPPSDPRRPRISGRSCDRDVVNEVARLLGVRACQDRSKRIRDRGWTPSWRVLARGTKAIDLMLALMPVMGNRRKRQIISALSAAKQAGNQALSEMDF